MSLPISIREGFSILEGSSPEETEKRLKGEGCFVYVMTDEPYFVNRLGFEAPEAEFCRACKSERR